MGKIRSTRTALHTKAASIKKDALEDISSVAAAQKAAMDAMDGVKWVRT